MKGTRRPLNEVARQSRNLIVCSISCDDENTGITLEKNAQGTLWKRKEIFTRLYL